MIDTVLDIGSYILKETQQKSYICNNFHFSSKDLQPMVSSINVCLNSNSPGGKLNGLLALEVLVEDCSSQLFTQVGSSPKFFIGVLGSKINDPDYLYVIKQTICH